MIPPIYIFEQSFEIIIFGEKRIGASVNDGININWVGRISDDRLLRMYYCAADLVIVPSRQDNLPCVAMESMSCGTPVAAFAVGGLCDLIKHCENGWLSAPFDTTDLANGIIWMLEDTHRLHQLGTNARKFIVENHNQLRIGKKYSHFYESILNKPR